MASNLALTPILFPNPVKTCQQIQPLNSISIDYVTINFEFHQIIIWESQITSIQATSLPTSVVSRNVMSPLIIGVSTGIAGGILLLVGLPVLIVVILIRYIASSNYNCMYKLDCIVFIPHTIFLI